MAEVVDQAAKGQFKVLSNEDIMKCEERFEHRMEGPCPRDEKPTPVQLSALFYLIMASLNPFVDFAIWGPFPEYIDEAVTMIWLGPDGVWWFQAGGTQGAARP